jgi:cell division septation protein DedD
MKETEQIADKRSKTTAPFETNRSSFLPSSKESLSQFNNSKDIVPEETASTTEDFSEKTTGEEAPKKEKQYAHQGYFIITGSFKNSNNAQQHIRELEQFGFSPVIVDENSKGYHRVAALKENSRSRAIEKLNFIRREDYPDAWLLAK